MDVTYLFSEMESINILVCYTVHLLSVINNTREGIEGMISMMNVRKPSV
jgi:hypothetical protein